MLITFLMVKNLKLDYISQETYVSRVVKIKILNHIIVQLYDLTTTGRSYTILKFQFFFVRFTL